MSFFEGIFRKGKKAESVVLIDIGANSVAGAYVRYEEGQVPTLLYAERLFIEVGKGESREGAMFRALHELGGGLIREGAPILARTVGSGSATTILVSIDAPWQETTVRIEHFNQDEPFLFTRGLVADKLEKASIASSGKTIVDEGIIGTTLNGYETKSPFGKRAHRATITVLSSIIDRRIASGILSTIQGLFHTKRVLPIAGSSLRYQAMRIVFPHEHDALILDATGGSLVSIALVRKGIFATMSQVSSSNDAEWVTAVTNELATIAKEYPLPRIIFLLAHESEMPAMQERLGTMNLNSLWLSDNPPKIVPILKSYLADLVKQTTAEPADLILLFMMLYYRHCVGNDTCNTQ